MENKIREQHEKLMKINKENRRFLEEMRRKYAEEVKEYERMQAEVISKDVAELVLTAKNLFPDYEITPTKFGIKIQSNKGIAKDEDRYDSDAEDENSGLGSWKRNPSIYRILNDELGPNVIKTKSYDIAWFDADDDSDYNDKTSWVYTMLEFEFKKPYLNNKFNFKTAPNSKV